RPDSLYADFATAGTKTLDGREHVVLKMTPKAGDAETWFVDSKTFLVSRIDMALPAPEGADAVWALGNDIAAEISFSDWKPIDGVQYPHRRSMKMGTATVSSTCTKIEPNAVIDAVRFAPPEAVTKLKGKAAAKASATDTRPGYQIVDREAQ